MPHDSSPPEPLTLTLAGDELEQLARDAMESIAELSDTGARIMDVGFHDCAQGYEVWIVYMYPRRT